MLEDNKSGCATVLRSGVRWDDWELSCGFELEIVEAAGFGKPALHEPALRGRVARGLRP